MPLRLRRVGLVQKRNLVINHLSLFFFARESGEGITKIVMSGQLLKIYPRSTMKSAF